VIPAEAVVVFFAFVGAAAGAVIGDWAHHRLCERKFAREATRVTVAPYDWSQEPDL
jgi:hypothetical protein